MRIATSGDPTEIRLRLRFLASQYGDDVARAGEAEKARTEALRSAGVPVAALERARGEAALALRHGAANRELLAQLFAAAAFVPVAAASTRGGGGGAFYDAGTQVLRGLARDWSDACAAVRAQSLEPVLRCLEEHLGSRAAGARLWVPGCGLGRLAVEAAARLGCAVTASDESAAMLAAFVGLSQRRRAAFFPALDAAAPGLAGAEERFREAEAVMVDEAAAAAESLVTLEHGDCTAPGGREAAFEAVATVFVLDAVASLPLAVRAAAAALREGGVWINYGPLRAHRGGSPPFTFADVAALAEAYGLTVLKDERFADCDYVPREVAGGMREVYDVQLLVARKGVAAAALT